MTQSEVVNILNTFQKDFKVNEIEYRGKPVWPILRYYLAYVLLIPKSNKSSDKNDAGEINITNTKSNILIKFNKVTSILKWPFLFFKAKKQVNQFLKLNTETLFISPSFEPYPDMIEGKKYSRYIDPYFEIFAKNNHAIKIQLTKPGQNFLSNFIKVHEINEAVFLDKIEIEEKAKRFRSEKKEHRNFYKQLRELNNYVENNKINYLFNTWLVNSLDEITVYENLFKYLLSKSNVKQVFFETYYSPCLFGLIATCKELGIKTVDIQHGVVDINYIGWNSINPKTTNYLPDYYWVWSKADSNFVKDQNSIDCLKPIIGGNMWMSRFINNKSKINTSDGKLNSDYSKKILVSLQHGEGFMNYMRDLIVSVIEKSPKEYLWMFRFHPLSPEKEVKDFKKAFENYSHLDFEWATNSPLYEIFSLADFHVVGSSAVALEGMQFGIPTVIVHPIGQDLFRDLINKNVFYYSLDATEILHQVENFKSKELDEGYQIKVSEQLALETFNSIILQ